MGWDKREKQVLDYVGTLCSEDGFSYIWVGGWIEVRARYRACFESKYIVNSIFFSLDSIYMC